MLDVLKAKRVAVIGDATGYGTATMQLAVAELKKAGADVTYSTLIDANQTDVTARSPEGAGIGAPRRCCCGPIPAGSTRG